MERTRPTDIIAASIPHWLFLRTGRKAVMVPFGAGVSAAVRLLATVPVDYFVLDDVDPISLSSFGAPAIKGSPEWRVGFTSRGSRIIAQTRSGPAAAPGQSPGAAHTLVLPAC